MPRTPQPNEHWAYRAKGPDPLTHVKVIEFDGSNKKSPRVVIEHIEAHASGTTEKVPAGRLKVPWENVAAFRQAEADNERVDGDDDTCKAEEDALDTVFEVLCPAEVAEVGWRPSTVSIYDLQAFERILGESVSEVVGDAETATIDGNFTVSPNGAVAIGRWLCERNPAPIIEAVLAEEARAERRCMGSASPDEKPTSAEIAWEIYCEYTRPQLEVLRQWCGYRAVTATEQALANEAELRRLKELANRVIQTLRCHDARRAEFYDEELRTGAVTGPTIRPAPARPLPPNVVTVEVPRRRFWG